jgi:hypothetical protein
MPAQAGIQYAAASRSDYRRFGVLDRPVKLGNDGSGWVDEPATIVIASESEAIQGRDARLNCAVASLPAVMERDVR